MVLEVVDVELEVAPCPELEVVLGPELEVADGPAPALEWLLVPVPVELVVLGPLPVLELV